MQGNQDFNYVIPVVVLLLLAFRAWRTRGRQRDIRIERLWILPALFLLIVGGGIAAQPVPLATPLIAALLVAFIAGLGFGWLRGRMTRITIAPETHVLKASTNPLGYMLIAALFLVRILARNYLTENAAQWHVPPAAIIDGFMVLALGMIVGWQGEIFLRCLRLLAQARAVQASGQAAPAELTEEHV